MKKLVSCMLLACLPLACAPVVHSAGRTYSDPSATITVKQGEEFTISLDSNRTTGYRWMLAGEPDGRVVRHLKTDYLPAGNRRTGAGGLEVWSFVAVSRGKTVVTLHYLRPWEKDASPARKVEFSVLVE